jgi:hypothetical protein
MFLALLMLVVFCARGVLTEIALTAAADHAARAASTARTTLTARTNATAAATADLCEPEDDCPQGIHCQEKTVSVDLSDFRPGGAVAVALHCEVPFEDIVIIGVPATIHFSVGASSPVDAWRATYG